MDRETPWRAILKRPEEDAQKFVDAIIKQMFVPVIQGALKYAWESAQTGATLKYRAEAATFAAAFTYQKTVAGANPMPWAFGGVIGGLILAMVISFKPKLAPMFALPYALLEGLFLGAISAIYAIQFSGENALFGVGGSIVFSAVVLTFAVSFAMFGLYAFRVIRVTEKLRSIVIAATAGIMFFYLINFVLGFFGLDIAFHRSGAFGIGFSLFVVALAAFNLLIDFDLIERGTRSGAPKYMEWFGAFALIVTLVWLYIELLRLLAIIANSRD